MAETADALDSKLLLGRYRVVRLLGEGGMGRVYLARVEGAEGFTRPVVVKRMRSDIKAGEEGNRLFIREAQILSKLQHPGIINIIDFGIEDGAHIMVLEYVHGYTLAPWLDYRFARKLPLPVDLCIYIVRRVLDALNYAHHFDSDGGREIEIVHRDIAPDNVLISKKGFVHLLDFGIASMTGAGRDNSTKSGVFRGKLGYAAPETVEGNPATPRSDQYSAGVLLLELLIQETPFFSDSIGETVVRMVNETPPSPSSRRDDVPKGLDEVVLKSLEKKPLERYESVLEFSRELRRLQVHDDDEVAHQLRQAIAEDFERLPDHVDVEPLKVREEALARIFPKGLQSTMLEGAAAEETRAAAAEILRQQSAMSAPAVPDKKIQGLLLGLLVVGGLIALGLGAAVALLSKGGGGEQVVVVGGEDEEPSALASGSDASAQGTSPPFVAPTKGPAPEGAKGTDIAAGPASDPKLTRQQKLSLAVQEKSAGFEACFLKHLAQSEPSPEAFLHFSVEASGGSAQVKVEPQALADRPLGTCLKDAASQVRFPPLDQGVSFRVPVRARMARFKNTP